MPINCCTEPSLIVDEYLHTAYSIASAERVPGHAKGDGTVT